MEILRDYKQIATKTKQVINVDVQDVAMLDHLDDNTIEHLADRATLTTSKNAVGDLAELIFQLREYVPILCNYVKIFLNMNQFGAVYDFLSKLFVAHVGQNTYQSKLKLYTFKERYFDRFIEIVKTVNIPPSLYLNLVFDAISNDNSPILVWHDIATEYMQNLIRDNEDVVFDFVEQNPKHKAQYLKLILEFNTQRGINIIFNNSNLALSDSESELLLKKYITDTINFFNKNLPSDAQKRLSYITTLAKITNNLEINAKLEDVLLGEPDPEIREFLAKRLNKGEISNFGSERHFQVMAQKKVEMVQQRSLGVAFDKLQLKFKNGEFADNLIKTYLINIFKNETNLLNLYGLKSVYDIFDETDLNNFAEALFDKHSTSDDILCAKWCVRMFSLLSYAMFERKVYEFLIALYKLRRFKEAKYLTECLIYSKKTNLTEVFLRLDRLEAFKPSKEYFLNLYAEQTKQDINQIKDELVCEPITQQELEEEKQRLYMGFVAGRKYSVLTFKRLFISNTVFNKFANGLVFGEYKQNKLYSVFVVLGKDIKYVYGSRLPSEDNEVYISVVHSLDLDSRFEGKKFRVESPLFNQFEKSNFSIKEINRANISFNNLNGTIINGGLFVQNIQKKGFVPNINSTEVQFTSIVHQMPMLNLLTELEFERPITKISPTATLGNIRFYKLSDCMKDRDAFITNKAKSISLGGVPDRYFDYCLSSIRWAIST